MKIKSLLMAVLFLLVAAAVASSPAPNASEKNSSTVIKTYLQADLSLKSVFQSPATAQLAIGTKTCRCSCGQPCTTNADCGGNICAVGITCCNNPSKQGTGTYSAEGDALSSHKDPARVTVSINCKQ